MSFSLTATCDIVMTPSAVVGGFPSHMVESALIYAATTWTKKSADSIVISAAVNQSLDMAGMTKGRFLAIQASVPITIAITYSGHADQYLTVDPFTVVTATTDGTEFTAVKVTGTASVEYIIAGE
jgi:hypothetical protein